MWLMSLTSVFVHVNSSGKRLGIVACRVTKAQFTRIVCAQEHIVMYFASYTNEMNTLWGKKSISQSVYGTFDDKIVLGHY
jgi:predicted ATPase